MTPKDTTVTNCPSPVHRYSRLAALGSSFAAGPGIPPIVDRRALRSGRNYAHLLAERIGAELTDLTVSGATTSTILETPQQALGHRFAPQLDGLPSDADLVTITAGGNDLNYAGSLIRAGWGGWFTQHALTRRLGHRLLAGVVPAREPSDIARAAEGLARVAAEVQARAPRARILLVDYLTVIGTTTTRSAEAPFDEALLAGFRELGRLLSDAFRLAAEQSPAELVRVSAISDAHAVGSAEPWVVGFRPTFRGIPAFHPNGAGMSVVATTIEEHLRRTAE